MITHSKYPRGNVYLSGGMQHAKDLGASWRIECSNTLKKMKYFPLDITELDVAYTANHGELYRSFGSDPTHLLQMKSNIRKHFIFTDLQLIEHDSDALIVLYDESARLGAGTISECQYAYNLDLPIFIVNGYGKDISQIPGWLQALSTKIFEDFDSLYFYLKHLPFKILKRDSYGNHNSGSNYLCSLCGESFEKHNQHFVSKVSPLYCSSCVDVVKTTYEQHKDRYQFFVEFLENEAEQESK